MQTFFRIAAIFFSLGIIGNLLDGEFSPLVIVVAVVCIYFGWGHSYSRKNNDDVTAKKDKATFSSTKENKPMSERFTNAQKHALICCLYVVISSDDEITNEELEYISKVVKALKYEDFDEEKIVHNILNNREMIIDVVRNFNTYQQKELISLMEGAINADWQVKEIELMYADSILQQAGILNDRFLNMAKRLNQN